MKRLFLIFHRTQHLLKPLLFRLPQETSLLRHFLPCAHLWVDSKHWRMSTAGVNHTTNYAGLSLPTLDGARSKSTICPRLFVVMDDEDSRECPSQGANELARDDLFFHGLDERRGHGLGRPPQAPTRSPRLLQHRPLFQQRVMGLRHHSFHNFRERRDSNSFDTHDDCKS